MVDGVRRHGVRPPVPDKPFDELRRTDPDQARYFLGDTHAIDRHRKNRVGSQLTPPREFLKRGVDELLPYESSTFFPMMTLALGGLGAGWGAGTLTFEDFELKEAGLSWQELEPYYREVASDIGISGALDEDTAPMVLNIPQVQPPLEFDSNAQSIFTTYQRTGPAFIAGGFFWAIRRPRFSPSRWRAAGWTGCRIPIATWTSTRTTSARFTARGSP